MINKGKLISAKNFPLCHNIGMKIAQNLGWKIYLAFFFVIALGNFCNLFFPDSPSYIFYHVFMSFHALTGFFYFLNIVSAILTLLTIAPIFFTIYGKKGRSIIWRYLFWLRAVFDIFGRYYEFVTFKSFWKDEAGLGLAYLASLLLLLGPSYWIWFKFSFRKNSRLLTR